MDQEEITQENKLRDHNTTKNDHPFENANILSRVLFWWLIPLLRKGYKSDLQVQDMYEVIKEHSASRLASALESAWHRELKESKIKKRQSSLLRAFIRVFGPQLMFYSVLAIGESILALAEPVLLVHIISYFAAVPSISSTEAYIYGTVFWLAVTVRQLFFFQPFHHGGNVMGMKIRVAATAFIYRKALRLSGAAMEETSVGQIVNILSNDVSRFDQSVVYLPYFVIGPLQLVAIIVLLWPAFGPYSLMLLVIVCILFPLQIYMAKLFSKLRSQTALLTDDRIRIMTEIISGMRVIKIYTWENPFSEMVKKARRLEVKQILRATCLRALSRTFFNVLDLLISLITFVTYSLTSGNALSPSKVFLAIPLYNVVRMTFGALLPSAVMCGTEATISIKRIQKFMELDEIEQKTTKEITTEINGGYTNTMMTINNMYPADSVSVQEEFSLAESNRKKWIKVENMNSSWNKMEDGTRTLNNISLSVESTELLVVIGPVGAGKSSLLMALLGEMPSQTGTVSIQGKIGYTSQIPWIFSGTLRNNILFGQPFCKSKYESVITQCALTQDLRQFPEGDLTLVGERGVTLSGGQKARVGLARAVYSNADVYLLDDPLSAVDTSVGRHLFEQCICGVLAGKPRILVTHQLQYLHSADKILILNKGEASIGTYEELQRSGVDFAVLKESREESNKEDTEEIDIQTKAERILICNDLHKSTVSVKSEVGEEDLGQVFGEKTAVGTVGTEAYIRFFLAGCGILFFVFFMVVNVATQVSVTVANWWLAEWAYAEENSFLIQNTVNRTFQYTTESTSSLTAFDSEWYSWIFGCLVGTVIVLCFSRAYILAFIMVNASKNLHNQMFDAIIRAPMQLFDTNPVGRILNRFAKDIGIMDEMLPMTSIDFNTILLIVIGIVIFVCVLNPIILVFTIPLFVAFFFLRLFYLETSRDVRRLEGITRSPVFSHLSASLQGLSTIRAFQAQDQFCEIFDKHQDLHTRAWYLFLCSTRWFGVATDIISAMFIMGVVFSSVIAANIFSLDSATIGLSLAYALSIMNVSQWGVRQSAEVENQMTSTERVLQYIDIKSEAPLETDLKPTAAWPADGRITFEDVSLRYSNEGPDILNNISCCIQAQEKVGVVGRTGAGKSSLMVALLRLAEPGGVITIDGLNITKIGLHHLRQKLSFIPQDPVLFSGTLRKNLDPFAEHEDSDLWRALDEVELKTDIQSLENGLDAKMTEGGDNFSVGQRQLVCLARAILRRNNILIVDEATANVDLKTDELIQATIRQRFKHCTVLTIAHRLNTVMDSDRILVIDRGRLAEFDTPYILLQREDSLLTHMVLETGRTESAKLNQMAKEKYDKESEGLQFNSVVLT